MAYSARIKGDKDWGWMDWPSKKGLIKDIKQTTEWEFTAPPKSVEIMDQESGEIEEIDLEY